MKDFVLKLIRNVYGQKQAGRVWDNYLADILVCVLNTDSLYIIGPDLQEINQGIEDIKAANFGIIPSTVLQVFETPDTPRDSHRSPSWPLQSSLQDRAFSHPRQSPPSSTPL
jgi:hypothetical protein